jgi:hypothetical protein
MQPAGTQSHNGWVRAAIHNPVIEARFSRRGDVVERVMYGFSLFICLPGGAVEALV